MSDAQETTSAPAAEPEAPAAEPSWHDSVIEAAREAAAEDPAPAAEPEPETPAEPDKPAEPEAPQEPDKPDEPEEPPAEPRGQALAALARKERKILEREAGLKALQEKADAFEAAMREAKSNPLRLLEAAGLSVAELTEYLVEGKPAEPKPEDRIAQLEARIEAMQQGRAEQEQASLQAQQQKLLTDFQAQLGAHIEASAEKYPLVQRNDAAGVVLQVIQQHAAQTGRILANDEACLLVEQELSSIAGLPAGQASIATSPAGPVEPPGSSGPQEKPKAAPQTLSNDLTAAASGKEDRDLTDAEREANAIAILRRSSMLNR